MDVQHEKITIEDLPDEFVGRGSTRKFIFKKVEDKEDAAIFSVHTGDSVYYEVFKKKVAPVCTDFVNRTYSETEFKYTYPNDNAFGVWAWVTFCKERAMELCSELVNAAAIKTAKELDII